MSRVHPADTAVAALATAVVSWPLTTLFTPNDWIRPTMVMVALVAAAGLLGRRLTTSKAGVLLVQLVAVVVGTGWLYGRGHLWYGLPTVDMVFAFNNLLVDARETIQNYAAPAPTNRGLILGVGLAMALTAMLVDHLAVMRRSPALAGLPLLTAFLISASNSGSSLHPVYFLMAAAVWLVMVGRQGIASVRRWSTTAPLQSRGRGSTDRDGALGFASLGRTLGVAALAAAVVLPVVTPHLPTRYLVDGLGRATDATGFSDGQIGLNSTLDLTRSLEDRSLSPVLSYTTTAATPTPLRVGVLTTYRGGEWRPDRSDAQLSRRPEIRLPDDIADDLPRKRYRISVGDSRLQAPQLAAPYPLVAGDLDGAAWGLDPQTQVPRTNRSVESYTMDYVDLQPPRSLLEQPTTDRLSDSQRFDALRVDRESAPAVEALVRKVVPEGATRIEAAMAIQEHLRSSAYRYSLQLPGPVRDDAGREVPMDPPHALPHHPYGVLRAVRHRDGDAGARHRHPGPDGDRLPPRWARQGRLHRARRRCPRVARAVLRGRRLAAVRAHAGHAERPGTAVLARGGGHVRARQHRHERPRGDCDVGAQTGQHRQRSRRPGPGGHLERQRHRRAVDVVGLGTAHPPRLGPARSRGGGRRHARRPGGSAAAAPAPVARGPG